MERRECETRYELAAAILPSRLRRIAMELPETDKRRAEEFRLRAGHCLSVLLPEGERSLEAIVTTEELETLCDIAAEFSRYASIETLRQGFLPVRGGFRVGLCGSAVVKDGEVTNLKQISSAVIRISREQKGIAQAVAPGCSGTGGSSVPCCCPHREAARPRCCGIWCGSCPKGRASRLSGSPSSTSGRRSPSCIGASLRWM